MLRIVVASLAVVCPVTAFSASADTETVRMRSPNAEPVVFAPDSFDPHKTYLVEEGKGWVGVKPYANAGECGRVGAYRGDTCINGTEATARFGSK